MATSQLQHAFQEASIYHGSGEGFFSLLFEGPRGAREQTSHQVEDLHEVIGSLDPQRGTCISQAQFRLPNRQVVNLWRMPLAFVDLDTYDVHGYTGQTPEAQLWHLLRYCSHNGIPEPTLVVFSGRGLHLKWIFETPVHCDFLGQWQELQNQLCQRLKLVGADPNARDASRVLRLVGTVNGKNGQVARVIHESTTSTMGASRAPGGRIVYDFAELSETLTPQTWNRPEKTQDSPDVDGDDADGAACSPQLVSLLGGKSAPTKANLGHRALVPSQLAWARLTDLRKLVQMRGWTYGAPPGRRDLFLFLAACFLAQAVAVPSFREEINALAKEFAPTWSKAQVHSCVSSVLARTEAAARGVKIEFNGRKVEARYRYRNSTLIEMLRITPDEEREMSCIVSKSEARRRDAARKRRTRAQDIAQGLCRSRAAMLEEGEGRRATARILRAKNHSWRDIAIQVGYPTEDAARMACKPEAGERKTDVRAYGVKGHEPADVVGNAKPASS
jgi:hypothetical protein